MGCGTDSCGCKRSKIDTDNIVQPTASTVSHVNASISSQDDVWADDEPTQTPAVKRIHTKQGYVDGVALAQEASLQRGFDDGYGAGAQLGVAVGEILAQRWGTPEFERACTDLKITNVLDRRYFDDQLSLLEHPLVSQWQQSTN